MSKLVWSYKRLPALDDRVGFVEVSDSEASTLIASGDVQDLKIGAKALKYIDDAYSSAPAITIPDQFDTPTSSAITATGFKVTWTAPNGGSKVNNYEVKVTAAGVDVTGSPFIMAGTTLSKTVSGLTASTDYVVTVKAINTAGELEAVSLAVSTIA